VVRQLHDQERLKLCSANSTHAALYALFSNSSLPISMRRISLVPAPIS
jgi:hypothetical protein